MTPKEIIETLCNSYIERSKELSNDTAKLKKGLLNVEKVFLAHPCKAIVHELVSLLMQPSTEEAYIRDVYAAPLKGNKRIQVNTQRGMGLKLDVDTQIEILDFIDSSNFRSKAFCDAFAKRLREHIRRF